MIHVTHTINFCLQTASLLSMLCVTTILFSNLFCRFLKRMHQHHQMIHVTHPIIRLLFYIVGVPYLCSRYTSCMDYLTYLKPNLLLDIHMHDHVEILYTRIRNKALIQYAYPYSSLDMKIMATVFKTDVTELQQDIEALITTNQLKVLS